MGSGFGNDYDVDDMVDCGNDLGYMFTEASEVAMDVFSPNSCLLPHVFKLSSDSDESGGCIEWLGSVGTSFRQSHN